MRPCGTRARSRVAAQRAVSWRLWTLAFVLVIPNALILFSSLQFMRETAYVFDWELIEEAHSRIGSGTMYDWGAPMERGDAYLYKYSPLLPYVLAPVLAFGLELWRVLHAAALTLLPLPAAGLVLASGPFWMDVANGNFLTFVVIAAWFGIGGNRWGQGAYFALTLLIPRPLMAPVAVWLLWQRPESRLVALGVASVLLPLTVLTGEALAWVSALVRSGDMIGAEFDWGPSRFLGAWWLAIGVPLGAWLTWRRRLGFASIAVSPYIVGYYLLMLLLELAPNRAPSEPASLSR